jgi:hypothetical protein
MSAMFERFDRRLSVPRVMTSSPMRIAVAELRVLLAANTWFSVMISGFAVVVALSHDLHPKAARGLCGPVLHTHLQVEVQLPSVKPSGLAVYVIGNC